MKKHAILLVIAALALAACGSGGGGGGVAATVNGEDITVEQVEALITGDGEEIPKADFAGALGFLVQQQIVSDAAEADLDIVIPEEEVTAEATLSSRNPPTARPAKNSSRRRASPRSCCSSSLTASSW